jgi:nitrosocyanin
MKKPLAIAITALLLTSLTACQKVEDWENQKTKAAEETATEEITTPETTKTETPAVTEPAIETTTPEVTAVEEPAPIQEIKTFNITAKQFEFIPNTISVNEGDKVVINLTSEDVMHGFAVTEYGISQTVEAGQTATIEFTADKKGIFTFKCPVDCGEGHTEMIGNLIVN